MAQFYAKVYGSRGTAATKTGTKSDGIDAHISGWTGGIRVRAYHSNGRDVFEVYETGGSNSSGDIKLIATLEAKG